MIIIISDKRIMVIGLITLGYEDRLKELGLMTLEVRRKRVSGTSKLDRPGNDVKF